MIAADHLAYLLNQPLADVCRSGQLLAEGLIQAHRRYHSDFIIVFSDVSVEPEAVGVPLEYSPNRNPQPIKPFPSSEVQIKDITSRGRIPDLFLAARICRDQLNSDIPIFFSMKDPFSLAAMTIGTESFLEKVITDVETVVKLLDICTEIQLGFIRKIISEGFIPFIGAPIASGGLIGQRYFHQFAAPFLLRLLNEARKLGSFRCLHICGEIGTLSGELASLQLDILSFEDWHPSMWEQMPGTIPMGYINTDLFVHGSENRVRQDALECLRTMPKPCILSTGCDLPASADPKMVSAMMKA